MAMIIFTTLFFSKNNFTLEKITSGVFHLPKSINFSCGATAFPGVNDVFSHKIAVLSVPNISV